MTPNQAMKPRWVRRGEYMLQRKTNTITWVVYKRNNRWNALNIDTAIVCGRFATKREAKLWVQREEKP